MVTTLARCAEHPAGQVSRAMRIWRRVRSWMPGPLLTPDLLPAPPEVQRALLTLGHVTRDCGGDLAAAQSVLLSAPGMDVTAIARVAFTGEDRFRAEIRNFNPGMVRSLCPRHLYPG